jgi:large subunit ribosomal protein L4
VAARKTDARAKPARPASGTASGGKTDARAKPARPASGTASGGKTDARAKPARPASGTASGALRAPVLDKAGKSAKSLTLEAGVFGAEVKPHLVHETVRAELNAARAGTRGAKSRGLVAGGRSKPWRQKGTGRARAGSIRAPQWTGGGLAFPPQMRSFESKVNRKVRRAALRSALSAHAQAGTLGVLDAGGFDDPSTKAAAGLVSAWAKELPLLLVAPPEEEALIRSFRNLDRIAVTVPGELEVQQIVWARSLLISEAALEQVQERAQ